MTMPSPMQHRSPHSSSSTTTSKLSPWSPMSQNFNQTNTLRRSWRDLKLQGRLNPPADVHELFQTLKQWPSQSKWFTTWYSPCLRDAGLLLILHDIGVTKSQNRKWLNFYSDKKSVKIMNSDLNQLKNEIWWTLFFVLNFLSLKRIF